MMGMGLFAHAHSYLNMEKIDYIKLLEIASFIALFIFRRFLSCLPELLFWWSKDLINYDRELFRPFGCWFFVGKQGSGKTMSLIYNLEKLRKRYPKVKIYTNMGYKFQTGELKSLNQLLDKNLYNGKYGTIFVIDEIQNEFSSKNSKDFPETVLSLITQQRKQRILILCTSQVFTRVSKPLREQCYRAIECQTFFGRYTRNKVYNGILYCDSVDLPPEKRKKNNKRLYLECYVQTDYLRNCFNSYKLINRLSRYGFIEKVPNPYISVYNTNNYSIKKRTR